MNITQYRKTLSRIPFNFEPDIWKNFSKGNCYEYLLNFKNNSNISLTVGSLINKEFQSYQSDEELIIILKQELYELGFCIEKTDQKSIVPLQKMKFFISRSLCGDYHFYRLDSNGKWSHKFAYSLPTNSNISNSTEIIFPETSCSTDRSIGYYLLGLL